jgi:hypothetical protein
MRDLGTFGRLTAVVLAVVLFLTLAAPARAEAEVLLIVGLVSVAVIIVIVVVYLVVASSRGPKMPTEAEPPTMMACVQTSPGERDCWAVPEYDAPPTTLAQSALAPQS